MNCIRSEASELCMFMKFRPTQASSHINYQPLPPNSRSYPTFHPHITLAAFKTLPPNFSLAKTLEHVYPVSATFQTTRLGNSYLGAFSVQLHKTKELESLHEIITGNLRRDKIEWRSPRFPHMSLFYVEEAEERKRLERGLIDGGHFVNMGNSMALRAGKGRTELSQFSVSEIWLVHCHTSNVMKWKILEKIQIASDASSLRQETN
ncbi:hypothetical protein DL96DRAFT_1638333 [Flagelloscypha sp. PMI_526]|nr:hypothetical protein DL96DRAFT_1638333 [Flagelloscypha sp. PMI_526]